MECRALYNSLRMNWLRDPKTPVEPWQVEDYRALTLDVLFSRLGDKGLHLDRVSFTSLAEETDTPEELTNELLIDTSVDQSTQDQIYLLVFEIWRRLVPEKPCLSIFCDELDRQIDLYDRGETEDVEEMQDVLANLAVILDENTDQGADPKAVFTSISEGCAHDLETFLYDFIADQIDNKNISYASELLDDFSSYITDTKWFDLLQARLTLLSEGPKAVQNIQKVVQQAIVDKDLEFNLEVLSSLVQDGNEKQFVSLVTHTASLLETEEEFQDLLNICAEYFHYLDQDQEEQLIQDMLKTREKIPLDKPFDRNSDHLEVLMNLLI